MKKKVFRIAVLVVLAVLLVGIIPFPHAVSYNGSAMEYSLTQEDVAIPHQVVIDGTYYTSLITKDRFVGTFYVSDIKGLDEDMTVDFRFQPAYRYHPAFLKPSGEPCSTEIGMLFFSRNFEKLAMQLAFEYVERDNGKSISFGDDQSNFIVIGAENRDAAIAEYTKQLAKKAS